MVTTIINPSARLLENLVVIEKGYEQTCRSSTCTCMSHDSGYSWVKAEIPEEVKVHVYPGSPSSHRCTVLWEEYVERHTTKGLPRNVPDWAYTLDNRRYQPADYVGRGVEVSLDGEFTVVRLIVGNGRRWMQENIFATKDGKGDHTSQYRYKKFTELKSLRLGEYHQAGVTLEEAERLFQIGKEKWTFEFLPVLLEDPDLLRNSAVHLNTLAQTEAGWKQIAVAEVGGLEGLVGRMSCPRRQEFARKALWVFHKTKPGLFRHVT